jgi:hypothetical protein
MADILNSNPDRPGWGTTDRPGWGVTDRPGWGVTDRPGWGVTDRPGWPLAPQPPLVQVSEARPEDELARKDSDSVAERSTESVPVPDSTPRSGPPTPRTRRTRASSTRRGRV